MFEEDSFFNTFQIEQAIELFWLGFWKYTKFDSLGTVFVFRARVSLWDFRPSVCFVEVRGLLELPCFVADSTDDEARAVGLGIKLDTYDCEGFRSYASSQGTGAEKGIKIAGCGFDFLESCRNPDSSKVKDSGSGFEVVTLLNAGADKAYSPSFVPRVSEGDGIDNIRWLDLSEIKNEGVVTIEVTEIVDERNLSGGDGSGRFFIGDDQDTTSGKNSTERNLAVRCGTSIAEFFRESSVPTRDDIAFQIEALVRDVTQLNVVAITGAVYELGEKYWAFRIRAGITIVQNGEREISRNEI